MTTESTAASSTLASRHLRVGWWGLALFATLGLALEGMHGLKIGAYLDVSNETRRLVWTLGHAHGTLLSLLNLTLALCVRAWPAAADGLRIPSLLLLAATALMPLGFLLGGVWIHGGDPGMGVLLVPPGGLCLVAAMAWAGRVFGRV